MENKTIKDENSLYFNENTILKREKSILEVDNENVKLDNITIERKYNNLKQENNRQKNEILDIRKSNPNSQQDKLESLAAQKAHYIARHEQILYKLKERFELKLTDIVKPLEDQIKSISRERDDLKKKMSLLERERQFFESENKRLNDRPALSSSLKGVQKEPMDLTSKEGTLAHKSISWTIPGD